MELQKSPIIRKLADSARELSVREKLALIVLAGALLRMPFIFVNFDSRVYQLWLDYVLQFGDLPYYDHPPLFFLVSGIFETLFQSLQHLNPYLYWYFLAVPLYGLYRYTKRRSPIYLLLGTVLLSYTWFVGALGNSFELGILASFYAGLGLIGLSYKIGEIHSSRTGLYAALFTAVSWWPVLYSRTLLIDGFAALVIGSAYYSYHRFLREENPTYVQGLVALGTLTAAFYTKYYALLLIPIIAVYGAYLYRDFRPLLRRSLPGVGALLLFLLWAAMAGFPFLDHYASMHYLFVTLPGFLAFGRAFWMLLTPLLLGLVLYGTYRSGAIDRAIAVFLLAPIVVAIPFYMFQAYVLGRSHALMNVSNYLLFLFPFGAVLAAVGWQKIIEDLSRPHLLSLILAVSLFYPVAAGDIRLEYDTSYATPPPGNLNTLTRAEMERYGLSDRATFHYVYGFERRPVIWSDYNPKKAHFRWISPKKIKIVALESTGYPMKIEPLSSVTVTLSQSGRPVKTYELRFNNSQKLEITPPLGISTYGFKTNRTDLDVVIHHDP